MGVGGVGRLGEPDFSGWSFSLYPGAGEGGGCFVAQGRPRGSGGRADPERARREAARRARARMRRYCAANRLNRLGTLTYRGQGCHDQAQVRADLGVFFRRLRQATGQQLPYAWVPEWHKSGHGLHAHFAVGRFIPRGVIADAWGHGFVHIKLLGNLPSAGGDVALREARAAAGYLSKYVSKSFDEPRLASRHRYDVAQGFQPTKVIVRAPTRRDVLGEASALFGGVWPDVVWTSDEAEDWQGPPAVWAQWAG